MYENSKLSLSTTYDEVLKARISAGEVKPVMIGNVDLNGVGTLTGGTLGYTDYPGNDWVRVRWKSWASRTGLDLEGAPTFPPSSSWFPARSWPISVIPPGEGSIDGESLRALSRILPDADLCYSMPAALTTHRFEENVVNESTFAELIDLLESGSLTFSPANIWPEDRSWFIYTDYDLWATRVSGPADLIARIETDPDLETIRWSSSSENP